MRKTQPKRKDHPVHNSKTKKNSSRKSNPQTQNLSQIMIANQKEMQKIKGLHHLALLHDDNLSHHLKKRTHAGKFTFKKKNENPMDDVDREEYINNTTLKSLAQILKNSKKTQKLSIDDQM